DRHGQLCGTTVAQEDSRTDSNHGCGCRRDGAPPRAVEMQREEMMKARTGFSCFCVGALFVSYAFFSSDAVAQTLKQVAKFDLPGPGGKRFDYLTIDADDGYLISAHLAADQTYVIDLATNKVIATVTDTPGAEGVEYVAELKKFYTSNAHDNTVGVVDLRQ